MAAELEQRLAALASVIGEPEPGVESRVLAAPVPLARRPRRRRIVLAAMAAALAVLAITPAGRASLGDAFDRLSSWLGREPGQPAPAADVASFQRAIAGSYAAFP